MAPRLYIDFIRHLPAEICLKILGYLDPVSLLSVARTCRAWYSLALDRTLWQTLYHYEGWKVVAHEIAAVEERVNRRSQPGSMHRQKSEEDGHTHKKRAVSLEDAQDQLMVDAGLALVEEPQPLDMENSLFGGQSRSNMTPAFKDLNMQGSTSSCGSYFGKGKGVDKGKGKAELDPPTNFLPPPASLVTSGLWVWDPSLKKQTVNWQYLYTMRRKLETNWEQGNFKNFQLPHPDHPEEGHDGECIYSLQYNEDYLVSGSRDKTLRIWSLATRRLVRKPLVGHVGSVLCLQFDSEPSEDIIVSGSSDSDVIIWRFSTGEIIQRLTHAHRESVLNVKFDKRILATCSKDRTIKIFNRRALKAGDPGYVYPVPTVLKKYGYDPSPLDQQPTLPPFTMISVLEGHNAAVNAVQIVNDEVVSASGDRMIKVWNWQTGICTRTFLGHNKGIACVQYDGKRIVSGSSDNEVKVFDRKTGIETASLRAHTDLVRTVQAGFGDLPWSAEEDAAEAKEVDQAYMKALDDGEISSGPQRGRPNNAGSSDVSEITAYGATLPPGGGGSRRWGRIVSGSYDKTIIIWRRDKTGKWKPQHHLKQEEAAQRTAGASPRAPPPAPPGPGNAPSALGTGGSGSSGGSGGGGGGSSRRTHLAGHPSRQSVTAVINAARAQRGMSALTQHNGEPSALGSVRAAGSSRESGGHGNVLASPRTGASGSRPRFSQPHTANSSTNIPIPPSSHQSDVNGDVGQTSPHIIPTTHELGRLIDHVIPSGTHALQQALSVYPAMLSLPTHLQTAIDREASPFVRSQLRQVVGAATVRAQVAQSRARGQGVQVSATATDTLNGLSDVDAGIGRSGSAPAPSSSTSNTSTGLGTSFAGFSTAVAGGSSSTPAPTNGNSSSAAGPPPAVATGATGGNHRAHTNAPEIGMPTRIYKLQFDARRIICCSQTSVIVGWDFCNGDPALEEVARFFATVE
ncbi:unnamed protein product [Discula destructiva]